MDYLIYNEEGEFVDVIQFETPEKLQSYKKANPLNTVEVAKDIDKLFLIEDDLEENEEDFEEDNSPLW